MSVLPYPPLHEKSKFIVLSDWDGTITDQDSNDYMTDNMGGGRDFRRNLNIEVLNERITFKDSFADMLATVSAKHSFEECKHVLQKNIGLDPGFKKFYAWCKSNDIPVIIVSSGMTPIIRAVLSTLLSPTEADQIDIISNDVRFLDPAQKGESWEIVFRHPDSGFGHDKSKAILPYRDLPSQPTLFFCGDGVSDMSAAKHADLLFTKIMANGDSDLMAYCKREAIPHVPFRDFNDVLRRVQEVVAGKSVQAVLEEEGN
ncbi:MAG: hypothetical protein TREMPRED_000712 [Tremellales sp. Tagirdzhanova-0007]|nr:MAG: hypothetical protein TREMPRED_000712 [Tremellales sp. Tagirdzhanova-0007]